jgi:hypothetical protein
MNKYVCLSMSLIVNIFSTMINILECNYFKINCLTNLICLHYDIN